MVKVQCRFCKPPNAGYYNSTSKFSMSRHRRKYKCSLPRSVPSPPKKYHSNAARKKGVRDRKRKSRANKKKVQPVDRQFALQRNVQEESATGNGTGNSQKNLLSLKKNMKETQGSLDMTTFKSLELTE